MPSEKIGKLPVRLKRLPKVAESLGNSGFVVGGSKTWDFVLSPKNEGETTIGPFSLSFFDPKKEEYLTASSDPITLWVTAGTDRDSALGPSVSRRGIENLASDIRFIKADKQSLSSGARTIHGKPLFYLSGTHLCWRKFESEAI